MNRLGNDSVVLCHHLFNHQGLIAHIVPSRGAHSDERDQDGDAENLDFEGIHLDLSPASEILSCRVIVPWRKMLLQGLFF